MPPHAHPPHAHPALPAAFSLFRASALQRLCAAGAAMALIWLAVFWALQ